MSNTTVEHLIKEYDLDVLEIEGGSLYLSCGRGLSVDEFNKLGDAINQLMENTDE